MNYNINKYSPEVLEEIGNIFLKAASEKSISASFIHKPVAINVNSEEYKELLSKPLWQLTGEQYKTLTEGIMLNVFNSLQGQPPSHQLIYGIDGLAKFLGTSKSTAQRIKKSGIINEAIAQRGRTIVIDGDKAIELLKTRSKHEYEK
ncbi:MAG: DUF3853 family protein [Prevotella sp.]|jgi:hypothetical protein